MTRYIIHIRISERRNLDLSLSMPLCMFVSAASLLLSSCALGEIHSNYKNENLSDSDFVNYILIIFEIFAKIINSANWYAWLYRLFF